MYGPDNANRHLSAASSANDGFEMTRQEIDRSIARAHRLRAEYLSTWGQKVARTVASLFRRPGRLLPPHSESRDRIMNAAQL